MSQQTTKPNRLATREERIDQAIKHLESVARLCRERRGQVIPFPPERSSVYR